MRFHESLPRDVLETLSVLVQLGESVLEAPFGVLEHRYAGRPGGLDGDAVVRVPQLGPRAGPIADAATHPGGGASRVDFEVRERVGGLEQVRLAPSSALV